MRQSINLFHRQIGFLRLILVGMTGLWLVGALCPAPSASFWYSDAPWLDKLVSEAVSKSYGTDILVKNIRLLSFKSVSFDSVTMRSKTSDKLLVSAGKGLYQLNMVHLTNKFFIQGDLTLENVAFAKEYYKKSPYVLRPFRYLMKKPILVKDMKVNILLGVHETILRISECHSQDITIYGRLTLGERRVIEDKLLVSYSPLLLLKNIF